MVTIFPWAECPLSISGPELELRLNSSGSLSLPPVTTLKHKSKWCPPDPVSWGDLSYSPVLGFMEDVSFPICLILFLCLLFSFFPSPMLPDPPPSAPWEPLERSGNSISTIDFLFLVILQRIWKHTVKGALPGSPGPHPLKHVCLFPSLLFTLAPYWRIDCQSQCF